MVAPVSKWWNSAFRKAPTHENQPYRVFTREFDRGVHGSELNQVLGQLSPRDRASLNEAWEVFQGALQDWRANLHLHALEASTRIRSVLSDEQLSDVIVAILIDQSGSMRGQNMLLAAAAADVTQNFLRLLGSAVEILGFTTVSWHGGLSGRKWRWSWRAGPPGRLCDLLHIIYEPSDSVGTATGGGLLKPMLRPDLPKENVDGEALEWAVSRLRAHEQKRKILIVISDGAPVDDSTLTYNDPTILERHLRHVIGDLESSDDIELGAIGISFDVDRYYSTSTTVKSPEDLGEAMISLLELIIAKPNAVPP
jgi:cobaltochelatase CobT